MVTTVEAIQRVEQHLFYEDEGLKKRVLSSVGLAEESVLCAKERIAAVVEANVKGPMKYVLTVV